jgi:hypothetical protein
MNSAMTTAMNSAMTTANDNFYCPITQEIMSDPVIGSDGITYERAAIEAWFAAGHTTSPLTRAPMTSQSLVPNIALRSLIRDSPPAAAPAQALPASYTMQPIMVSVNPIDDSKSRVRLSVADDPAAALPITVIDVLDISGSMGNSSVDRSTVQTDAGFFSRADLVRHSVATQIELLRPQDELGIVLFDDRQQTALSPIPMNTMGKSAAHACLSQVSPRGGTNIWGGLHHALKMADGFRDRNVVIILQTDGESDPSYNPPRGIVAAFQAWRDSHPTCRLTVHTVGYGFGRALDMPLLQAIAAAGNGTVNYIPDGSMVGTVFIHMMANLMSCAHRGVRIYTNSGTVIPVGFIQTGQILDFVVETAEAVGVTVACDNTDKVFDAAESSIPVGDEQIIVQVAIDRIADAIAAAEAGGATGPDDMKALHDSLVGVGFGALIPALRQDLWHVDGDKGQIAKALQPDNFARWGRHYLPAVLCSHRRGWPINFKDATSQVYGSATVHHLIDQGDKIFNDLPAPTASLSRGSLHRPINMASINSAAGPCFLGDGLAKMGDGSEKRIDALKAGDVVYDGFRVRCVIKTLVKETEVVRLGFGSQTAFTIWHPVCVRGEWKFPADMGPIQRITHPTAIYNFVLDAGHSLILNGVKTCTMAHDFVGPVISHPYFGRREGDKRNIIDDLQAMPGWADGYITLRNVQVYRNAASGLIERMTSDF